MGILRHLMSGTSQHLVVCNKAQAKTVPLLEEMGFFVFNHTRNNTGSAEIWFLMYDVNKQECHYKLEEFVDNFSIKKYIPTYVSPEEIKKKEEEARKSAKKPISKTKKTTVKRKKKSVSVLEDDLAF
jgi:hypothetical protein